MPQFGILTGTQDRSYGGLPTLPLVNLVAERALTEPRQFMLLGRPKIQKYFASALGGTYPIRQIFYTDQTSLGTFFAVFSTSFYEKGTGTSTTLNGDLIPSIAGNEIGVVATAGADAKWWDGSAFRSIAFPGGGQVTKVLESEGRFIFIEATSQAYYWTPQLSDMVDGSGDMTISALSYLSAEDESDWLVDGVTWKTRLVLAGQRTIEIHAPSGNSAAPWQPLVGSTIHRGVVNTGALTVFNDLPAWVSPDHAVYVYPGGNGDKISNPGIEEDIRNFGSNSIQVDSFRANGKEFLHIWAVASGTTGTPEGTYDLIFDASSGEWSRFETSESWWDAGPAIDIGANYPVFGAKSDSYVVGIPESDTLSGDVESTVEHKLRFGLPISSGVVPIGNVALRCETYGSASGSISLRTSRDKGTNWTSWDAVSFNGQIRQKIEWRGKGQADAPGYLCEIKTAGLTEFSISDALFNVNMAGRGRGD